MYIIDFDDTLFDTQAFKEARLQCVKRLGVTDDDFWISYQEARNTADGHFTYSDERHAYMLAQKGYNKQQMFDALSNITRSNTLHEFLNDGAVEFVQALKNTGKTMILLSLGDPSTQELKTKNSGVHKYFDRTFMVKESKVHVLKELFDATHPHEAWFVNDKIVETKELYAAFPEMNVALKKSPKFGEVEYKESGFPYFYSLPEIMKYVLPD